MSGYVGSSGWFSRFRRRGNSRKPLLRRRSSLRGALEKLEERAMLRTTVYVDFGEGFADGKLTMTAGELNNTLVGPNMGLPPTDVLEFQSLTSLMATQRVDFDGKGVAGDANDSSALRGSILSIMRRQYEPFDVDVKEAFATSTADVNAAYHVNDGDPTGQFDAYVFICGISDATLGASIGNLVGIFGIASAVDLFGGANQHDEAVIVCADIWVAESRAQGISIDVGIANTASHEAAHTFSLFHTNTGDGFGNDLDLLSGSDVIREGGAPSLPTRAN